MFYDKFVALCAQKGESPSHVAEAIGLSNAAATGWKNGKKPNDITLRRLSDYFSVPIEDLKDVPSSFYKNYVRLCDSIGKSPSGVAVELNIGKPSVTRWKHGGGITDATAFKIANYFHVPVAELMGDDCAEKEAAAPKDVGLSPMESQLMEYVRALTDDQKKMLLAQLQVLKNQE